jgi:hypothetical protein
MFIYIKQVIVLTCADFVPFNKSEGRKANKTTRDKREE